MAFNDQSLRQAVINWRETYRGSRYLEYLRLEDVFRRREQLLRNAYAFLEYRRVAKSALHDPEILVWQTLVEVSEELRLRGKVLRVPKEALCSLRLGGASRDFLEAVEGAISDRGYPSGEYIVRYGKRKYLSDALETGRLRISPASSFDNMSLPDAIKDNELFKEVEKLPFQVDLIHALSGRKRSTTAPGSLSLPIETDYYVFSFSTWLLPSLFWEFCKDDPACLIIRKLPRFFFDLRTGFLNTLGSWQNATREVRYIDPFPLDCEGKPFAPDDLFFLKDIRFFYEAEARLVWRPPLPVKELNHVIVEMPTLSAYAELLTP